MAETSAVTTTWYLDLHSGRVWMGVPDLKGAIYLGTDVSEEVAHRRAQMFMDTERARAAALSGLVNA